MRHSILLFIVALVFMCSCSDKTADTVVYGTIRTAEKDNPVAEAIAIKDGKYVYVGDKEGVEPFIKAGVTEIIDHRGKGMVMPGCTEGHAHYLMGNTLACMGGLPIDQVSDNVASFMKTEACIRSG